MDRRTLLTASFAVIGSAVTGCLEGRGDMGDSNDSGGTTGPTDTNAPEDGNPSNGNETAGSCPDGYETDEHSTICSTRFELLNEWSDKEDSASVTFGEDVISVNGIIMGRNGCYTARLQKAVIEDGQLIVGIESFDASAEDEGCTGALVFIEYEATVIIDGELPESVHIEHNGENLTTKRQS